MHLAQRGEGGPDWSRPLLNLSLHPTYPQTQHFTIAYRGHCAPDPRRGLTSARAVLNRTGRGAHKPMPKPRSIPLERCIDLELPAPDCREIKIVSPAPLRSVAPWPVWTGPIWATALQAGLRSGELRALRGAAVDH